MEWHLANAFRKLDISSRRDLAAALGDSVTDGAPVSR
ncbi:MAG: hypothetical protein ACRDVG_10700 [Jatrophihabitantaceae bacterium]